MIFKKKILTIFALIIVNVANAQTINLFDANTIASNFSKEILNDREYWLDEVICFGNNNDTSVYIFNFKENNGFVIIPTYKTNKIILAYSLNNKFDFNNVPPALLDLLRSYSEEIEFFKKNRNDDSVLKRNDIIGYKQGSIVQPIISTKWDQACFYNDSCPNAYNAGAYYCQKVPAGCVAIALAQIIRYYKYPLIGNSFNSYYNPYYGIQYANFGATFYNYTSMPDVLFSKNSTTAQFIYHCAVSVNTQFNYQYSGANINDAKNSLINYFNYSNSAQIMQKNNFTESGWLNLIKNELDSARPVFLSGYNQNNSGGHAFICDGYDNNNLFHINWGWGGLYNGYFALTSLTPNSNNFSYNQSAIINIKPQNNYPVCHFKSDTNYIFKNGSVQFTDLSSGIVNQWKWIFDGGTPNISYDQNPIVSYNQSGIYNVTLIVSGSLGSDTLTKKNYITVTPYANFSSNKKFISINESVVFYDNSIVADSILSYYWVFQGGIPSTSNIKNPIVSFNQPGTYNISLSINTINGNHSITKNNYITVYNQCSYLLKDSIPNYYINPTNSANFLIFQEDFDSLTPYYSGHSTKWNVFKQAISPGDTNFFYGATSFFTNIGQANNWLEIGPISIPANGANLKWKHLYYLNNKRDGYEVLLSTTGLTKDYYNSPPVFSRTDNDSQTDGNTSWTSQQISIPANIYGNSDIYIAFHHYAYNMYYLFLDDIELVSCSGLPVVANFKADTTNILSGEAINFTDLSSGNPISWEWTFYGGIPNLSYEQNPQNIKYLNAGVFPVKLKVFNGENTDSLIKINLINVGTNGFSNNQISNLLNIYPNPANDFTKICFDLLNNETEIQLIDMQGQILYQTSIINSENEKIIPLNNLKSGCYLIKIKNNTAHNLIFRKLIILK